MDRVLGHDVMKSGPFAILACELRSLQAYGLIEAAQVAAKGYQKGIVPG